MALARRGLGCDDRASGCGHRDGPGAAWPSESESESDYASASACQRLGLGCPVTSSSLSEAARGRTVASESVAGQPDSARARAGAEAPAASPAECSGH